MTVYVVDSSVVVKWFVPEVLTSEAVRLHDSGQPLHAPDFLDIEVANIAWKKMRRGEASRAEGDFIISQLSLLALTRHPSGALVSAAFDLADKTQRTVYDCLYLALAVQLGAVMVTADDKLANSLAGTSWAANVLRLQDLP